MVFGATGGNTYKQLIALAFYACITHKTNNSTVKETVLFMVPLPRCGGGLAQREKCTKLPHEDVSYGSLFSLMELFDPIRRGVHDGEDEEGQDGGDDEAACDGDGHRPPEDAAHEG